MKKDYTLWKTKNLPKELAKLKRQGGEKNQNAIAWIEAILRLRLCRDQEWN